MEPFKIYLNCKYYIGDKEHATRNILGIDENDNLIIKTNDYLHLINHPNIIGIINNIYKRMKEYTNPITIEETVIPIIPTYLYGTVHGFSSFYNILLKYLNNGHLLEEHSLLIYQNCCPAYIEVLKYLFNNGKLFCKNIMYIVDNQVYKFSKYIIIPNTLHSFVENKELSFEIKNMVNNNFIINKSLNTINNICILKNNKSKNNTTLGLIPEDIVNNLVISNNLTLIEPGIINEIDLYSYLQECEKCFISWSSFLKNAIYFSKKCKKINVIVYSPEFYREYNILKERNQLPDILIDSETKVEYTFI